MGRIGCSWSQLYLTFVIRDKTKRHALLRQAVEERWRADALRFTVQDRHGSNRRGVGGWPRRAVTGHGPEVTLRQMGRLSRRLAELHEGVWSKVADRAWQQLIRGWPVEDREKLRQLLSETDTAAERAAGALQDARRRLAKLLEEV